MLEGLVAWVLNTYVGEYFENLNTDQLSIALLHGQVELENVPLKKTALRKFDIPVQVKSGVIGRLTLTIPIHMRSEPWILKLSDVLVLLGPSTSKYDVQFVAQYEQSRMHSALDELENFHKKQLFMALGETFKDDSLLAQNQWWGASLVSAVTNNMQDRKFPQVSCTMIVIADNVHIRYEDIFRIDGVPGGERPFSFGIRLENITVQTTNAQWKPTFVQSFADGRPQSNTFKKLNIKRLSVYWNCSFEAHNEGDFTVAELKKKMSPENTKYNSYILQPFCMEARMEKNSSKFPLKSLPLIPRFKFDLRPEKIEIDFSKSQLAQIRFLSREWARFDRSRQHRKWRPICLISKNPNVWWKFIINRVIESNRKQHWSNKSALLTHVHYFNAYCKAYRKRLESLLSESSSTIANSSMSNQEHVIFMKQVEHDGNFSYDELHLFRETVFKKYLYELERLNSSKEGDNDVEIFEVISSEEPSKSNIDSDSSEHLRVNQSSPSTDETGPRNSGWWYGWMSNWFSNVENQDENQADEDVNEAFFLDLRPKIEEKDKHLTPELRRVEKQMEEEILDVLNETWDDSTILRRDTLLAELVFRLDKVVVRFMDNEGDNELLCATCNRVLSLDMRRVASRIHLSPREHRMEISLSVEDMSVQRLQILPTEVTTPMTPIKVNDELGLFSPIYQEVGNEKFESLLYGETNLNTQLLMTIGRAEEKDEIKHSNSNENIFKKTKKLTNGPKNPMLLLFYKRLAPKLDIYHELNIQLAPIFSMYDEGALNELFSLFTTDSMSDEQSDFLDASIEKTRAAPVVNSRLFLTLSVPQVVIELRRHKLSLLYSKPVVNTFLGDGLIQQSYPFALTTINGLKLSLINSEPFLSKIKLNFRSFIVEDLFEENCAKWPLLKSISLSGFYEGKMAAFQNNRSNSCHNLPDIDSSKEFSVNRLRSTSLPDRLNFNSAFTSDTANALEYKSQNESYSQFSPQMNCGLLNDDDGCKTVSLIFVDSRHPKFETEYAKQHCTINADLKNELEIGMNRRSWTTLLDFFGILGGTKSGNNEHGNNVSKTDEGTTDSYNVNCQVKVDIAKIAMNYSKNQTQLGIFSLNYCKFDAKVNLNNTEEPMLIQISALGLTLTDLTPFYSQLYSERLVVKRAFTENNPDGKYQKIVTKDLMKESILLEIIKYRTEDLELKRNADVELRLNVGADFHASYLHTQRYFFAFLEFWMNFAELQNRVFNQNEPSLNKKVSKFCLQKTRCMLDVDFISGLELIVPLNQFCEEAIIFTTTQFKIQNSFANASKVEAFSEHGIDHCGDVDDYDCLLDVMKVFCKNVKIFRGYRVLTNSSKAKRMLSARFGISSNYFFSASPLTSILNRLVDINIDAYRNLSSFISNSVPDFVVVTELTNVELSLNAQFYCLLRGVLEQNIGEQFRTQPETVPTELLEDFNSSYEIGVTSKYATFCFRMLVNNAQYHLSTRVEPGLLGTNHDDGTGHEPLARIELHNAKISFDSYIDGQFELYLICHSIVLFDSRFESNDPSSPRSNVFTSVISPKDFSAQKLSLKNLMCEVHIMVKKDEAPKITFVLLNARVLLIFDWLLRVKDFLLQTTDFVPPQENPSSGKYLYEVPKEGVLVRSISSANPPSYYDTQCLLHQSPMYGSSNHTYTLKITLKEMDLVLIENIEDPNSRALVGFTTGVLTADDASGILEVNFEIQKMDLCWCSMRNNQYQDLKNLTNDFSATISLKRDFPLQNNSQLKSQLNLSGKSIGTQSCSSDESLLDRINHGSGNKGIQIIGSLHQRQKLSMELSDKIEAKFSWNNFCELREILTHSLGRLYNDTNNLSTLERDQAEHRGLNAKPVVSISKIHMKCFHIGVCILDDSHISMPLFRFSIQNLALEKNIDRLNASMSLSVEYFNETSFGYDPLIESWMLEKLSIQWKDNHINVDIMPNALSVFNINLTQTFMQQMKCFFNRPSSITTDAKCDSSLFKAPTSSYRPYKASNLTFSSSGFSSSQMSFNATLCIPAGVGISLINNKEELIYLLCRGVKIHLLKQDNNYQFNTHVDCVQADNQLLNCEKWQFFYCEPRQSTSDDFVESNSSMNIAAASAELNKNSAKNSNTNVSGSKRQKRSLSSISSIDVHAIRPALSVEISYTPTTQFDTFEHFRVRFYDSSILLDEILLWKIIQLVTEVINFGGRKSNTLKKSLSIKDTPSSSSVDVSSSSASAQNDKKTGKACYFELLELEVGNVSLSATAVSDNSLPVGLRALKKQFNITLVSFENALVSIAAFKKNRYVGTFDTLFKSLGDFYLSELKKQKLSIVVTMDAFGNPMGLATDFKDSIEGLIFEGDVGGFVFGLGYGVTNSISKVASSMAQGIGFLTFDEQHEQMRRRMLRSQSQMESATALSHLYGGVKGLGVGVFGGLTAIAKNTYTATQRDGVSGLFRGVTTGAVDTVTKPLQGALDLIEGTASAFKEAVGSPLMRKLQFSENRLRLPRVCTNLQSRLPPYSYELAEAQQMLLRINSYSTSECLFDVINFLEQSYKGELVKNSAMICSEQCYILRQINDEPCSVSQRIAYKFLRNIQPAKFSAAVPRGIVPLEITYVSNAPLRTRGVQFKHEQLWCKNATIANQLSKKIMNAKNFYDRSVAKRKSADIFAPSKKAMSSKTAAGGVSPRSSRSDFPSSSSVTSHELFLRDTDGTIPFNTKKSPTSVDSTSSNQIANSPKKQETSFIIDYR